MKTIKIPTVLKKFSTNLFSAGFQAYLVGGAVRDIFLGKNASDWDVATNATPEQVSQLYKKVIPTGIAHGTVTVLFNNEKIEVTTFRTEADYSDGRHPDKIEYAATIEEDLSRRDFTMNAIALSLEDGKIVDPFHGQDDIKNKIIRTCGNPHERFDEDGLRPVRAIRFASQLNFNIEENTFDAIPKAINRTAQISIERFHDEFIKLLKSDKPSVGLKLLEDTGLLKLFIPELAECRGITQEDDRGYHHFDILDHLFYACDGAPKNNLIVRLAALFHDIGKKEARQVKIESDNQGNKYQIINFFNHEKYSCTKTEIILKRLKFSNEIIKNTLHLISNHMFHYESNWSNAAIRRFIMRIGIEHFDNLFDLRIADVYGKNNCQPQLCGTPWSDNLIELKNRISLEISNNNALSLKDLKLNGQDLINLGIPKGKIIGIILNELFKTVTEDPNMNDKEKLLKIVKNKYL